MVRFAWLLLSLSYHTKKRKKKESCMKRNKAKVRYQEQTTISSKKKDSALLEKSHCGSMDESETRILPARSEQATQLVTFFSSSCAKKGH